MRRILVGILFLMILPTYGTEVAVRGPAKETRRTKVRALQVVVMDPLSAPLACACVAGYAQRDYVKLIHYLQERMDRPIHLVQAETLLSPQVKALEDIDLIIGKYTTVKSDATTKGLSLQTLAMLTGLDGQVSLRGMFVVRKADPAHALADLARRRLLLGPADSEEKHGAGIAALEAFNIPVPPNCPESPGCSTAAIAVAEKEADCAVISGYAMPLLMGCGAIDKDELRIVGYTDPVPFITVFASKGLDHKVAAQVQRALLEVKHNRKLLTALESRDGFLSLSPAFEDGSGWPDWRGANRDGISLDVPAALPASRRLLWSRVMTGPGMAGLSASGGYVVAADKSLDETQDIFHGLDADTGAEIWRITYPAAGEMDFSNSPRAVPVIREGRVYMLGAFGHLHCADLVTGRIIWKRNLPEEFNAKVPTWGYCSTPLIVDDLLIVNPGAQKASLAALDRVTGKTVWTTPGQPPGYASFIPAAPHGVRQVIGYDAISLGGWDPLTGKRLWTLVPEVDGDFNVPTPVILGDQLLVSSENNGTRLYEFDAQGILRTNAVVATDTLAPDTSTPVAHEELVFGNWGGMVCLDLRNKLDRRWTAEDPSLADYCSFIAGNGRVLVTTQSGKMRLVKADGKQCRTLSEIDLFPDVADTERDVWSHPALVGNRLYVRNLLAVYCFLLE